MRPQKEHGQANRPLYTCQVLRIFSPLAFLSPLTPAPSALRVSPRLLLIQLCTLSSYIPKSSLTLLPPHENTQALILRQPADNTILVVFCYPSFLLSALPPGPCCSFSAVSCYFFLLALIYSQILPLLLYKYLARASWAILSRILNIKTESKASLLNPQQGIPGQGLQGICLSWRGNICGHHLPVPQASV